MKIAIASLAKNLESQVDSRFGRCPYFLIIDSETEKFELLDNTAGQVFRGAGISAAQMIVNKGVKAVIAGNFGPNAVNVLSQSGIKIFKGVGITIKEALKQYKDGKLPEVNTNNMFSGKGMGIGRGSNK